MWKCIRLFSCFKSNILEGGRELQVHPEVSGSRGNCWYKGSRSKSIVYYEKTANEGKPKYFHDYCASDCSSSKKVSLNTQTGDLTIMAVGLRDEDYYYYKFSVSEDHEAGEKYEIKLEVSCKLFFYLFSYVHYYCQLFYFFKNWVLNIID